MLLPLPLLLALVVGASAQTSGPQNCSFPSAPQYLPLPSSCPPAGPGGGGGVLDAVELAWRVAPIVYMHPLEPYKLQSPTAFFSAASMFYQDSRNASDTRYQFLAERPFTDPLALGPWGTRQFISVLNSTAVSSEVGEAVLAGAEVGPDGLTTAQVYYSVYEPSPDLWGFTFHLFYSFNGCSQQMFSLGVNGTAEVLDMRVCPFGTHEADWERVSVLACKADGEIKQVGYSQHSWTEILDCEAGQCPMEGGHPVSYAALETHANYPQESPFIVYELVNASLQNITLVNLGGVFIGDRAMGGPTASKFVPTPSNVVPIPDYGTILEQEGDNLTDWAWALFGGVWGGPLQASAPLMQCYYDNQTRLGDCPAGYALDAFDFGLQFYRKLPYFGNPDDTPTTDWVVKPPTNTTYYQDGAQGSGILGPLMRTYSYMWPPQVAAPLYSHSSRPLVCPGSLAANFSFTATPYTASISTLVKYLVGISGGCALFATLMAVLLALPALLDKQGGIKPLAVLQLMKLKRQASRRWSREGRAKGQGGSKARRWLGGWCGSGGGQEGKGEAGEAAAKVAAEVAAAAEQAKRKVAAKQSPAKGAASGKAPEPAPAKLDPWGLPQLRLTRQQQQQQQQVEQRQRSGQLAVGPALQQAQQQQQQQVEQPQGLASIGDSQPSSPGSPGTYRRVSTSEQELVPLKSGKRRAATSSFIGNSPPSFLTPGAALVAAASGGGGGGTAGAAGAQPSPALPLPPPHQWAHLQAPLPAGGRHSRLQREQQDGQQQQQIAAAGGMEAATRETELAAVQQQQQQQERQERQQQVQQGQVDSPAAHLHHQQQPLESPFAAVQQQDGSTASPLYSPFFRHCSPALTTLTSPASPTDLLASPSCPTSPSADPSAGPVLTAVVARPQQAIGGRHLVWAGVGFAMYVASIGMLAHGTQQLWRLGRAVREYIGLLYTFVQVLKIIVATGLSLTGLLDLLMIGILFLALWRTPRDPKQVGHSAAAGAAAGRRRGLSAWVHHNSHAVHVAMAVQCLVVASVALVLFGIGMVALVAQLVMQLLCAAVGRLSFTSIPLESLCVSLPANLAAVVPVLGGEGGDSIEVVCVWELVNVCFYLSDLLVWDLVVGAALLLWSHLVFLVLVTTSMSLHQQFKLSLRGADLRAAAAPTPAAPAELELATAASGNKDEGGKCERERRKGLQLAALVLTSRCAAMHPDWSEGKRGEVLLSMYHAEY